MSDPTGTSALSFLVERIAGGDRSVAFALHAFSVDPEPNLGTKVAVVDGRRDGRSTWQSLIAPQCTDSVGGDEDRR